MMQAVLVLTVCGALSVAASGCATKASTMVQSLAPEELRCTAQKIEVTRFYEHAIRILSARWPQDARGTYRAEGCGRAVTYLCDQWDSYNQKPICEVE